MLLLLSYLVQLVALVLCVAAGSCMAAGGVVVIVLEAHMGLRIAEHLRKLHESAKQARAMGRTQGRAN